MGWKTTYRCGESNFEFFSKEFGKDFEILEAAQHGYQLLFLAVKSKKSQGVFAVAVRCMWERSRYGGMQYSYRTDDESCGPIACCPESILIRLTDPPLNDHSENWRELCWRRVLEKKERPSFKVGDVVAFASTLEFTNGHSANILTVTSSKPLRFDSWCRIRRESLRDYAIIRNDKCIFTSLVDVEDKLASIGEEERGGKRMFDFQFDFAKADWSRVGNDPLVWLQNSGYILESFDHTFGKHMMVYKVNRPSGLVYTFVTRSHEVRLQGGRRTTSYTHHVISEEGFNMLKRILFASKLSA